jgi:predicted RNA-binding protein YlxR (DUF448 family)
MAKQAKAPRPRHVPQRTCVACRAVEGKRALIRIVRTAEGVVVDPTGKQAGRGAYLHPVQRCWAIILRGNRIDQALRTKLSPADRQALVDYMQTLPETDDETVDGVENSG